MLWHASFWILCLTVDHQLRVRVQGGSFRDESNLDEGSAASRMVLQGTAWLKLLLPPLPEYKVREPLRAKFFSLLMSLGPLL